MWWPSKAPPQRPPKIIRVRGADEKQPWAGSLAGHHHHFWFGTSQVGRCASFSFGIQLAVGVSWHVHTCMLQGLLPVYGKRWICHLCVGGKLCLRASWQAGNLVQAVSQQLTGVSVWEDVRGCQIFLGSCWNGAEGFHSLRCLCKTSWASQGCTCLEMLSSEGSCGWEVHLKLLLFWPLLEAGKL